MSDQLPPGAPPPPPPSTPPPYPGGNDGPPRRKDNWKIWTGIALTLPFLVVISFVGSIAGEHVSGAGSVAALAALGIPVALLLVPRTLKYGLGLLIGYAAILVIGAGACVAFLASGGLGSVG